VGQHYGIASPFVAGPGVLEYVALSTTAALTDIHVSLRSPRLVPLVIGQSALAGMLVGLLLLDASRLLLMSGSTGYYRYCTRRTANS
jgi:hypothetical protein